MSIMEYSNEILDTETKIIADIFLEKIKVLNGENTENKQNTINK